MDFVFSPDSRLDYPEDLASNLDLLTYLNQDSPQATPTLLSLPPPSIYLPPNALGLQEAGTPKEIPVEHFSLPAAELPLEGKAQLEEYERDMEMMFVDKPLKGEDELA